MNRRIHRKGLHPPVELIPIADDPRNTSQASRPIFRLLRTYSDLHRNRLRISPITFDEIVRFLEDHENPNGKKVLMRHGARDPFYGVRIGDLKKSEKSVPTDTAETRR
jgi:hypothetical protein